MQDMLEVYRECKTISIRRRNKEEKELELPRYIAASNLAVIQQVIEKGLESDNHSLRCEALQFFEYIPPNAERRDKMIRCKKIAKSREVDDWLAFMYSSGFDKQGLYYGLKIMKSILIPSETSYTEEESHRFYKEMESFHEKFLEYDGFSLLCETLSTLKVGLILKDVVWLSIFQMLTQILVKLLEDKEFLKSAAKSKKGSFFKTIKKLVHSVTEVLSTASKNVYNGRDLKDSLFTSEEKKSLSEDKMENIVFEYELFETDFYSYLIQLLKSCIAITPEEITIFYKSSFIKDGGLVSLLAIHPNKDTMKKVSESLYGL